MARTSTARKLDQRLGETSEFGWSLLNLLGLSGWAIAVTTPFAGAALDAEDLPVEAEHRGVLVIVSRGGYEIRRTGPTVAAIAPDVFQEAVRWQRLRIDHPVQLQITGGYVSPRLLR